jgi:small subunit ribosomal protein S16
VAVKIKLKRMGKIRVPQYRIVVADSRTKRDGRAIEELGIYQPMEDPSLIRIDSERVQYWLGVGAQPTEPVQAILKVTGDWQRFKGLPGAEGTLRTAEPRADKKTVFEAAVKDASAEPKSEATTPRTRAKKTAAKTAAAADAPAAAAAAPAEARPVTEAEPVTQAAATPAASADTGAAEAGATSAEASSEG